MTLRFSIDCHLTSPSKTVNKILVFDTPINTIISCCVFEEVVRIWDSRSHKLVGTLEDHTEEVYDMIKWNSNTFLTCSEDRTILSYSISLDCPHTIKLEKNFEIRESMGIIKILKLRRELLLCVTHTELLLIMYAKNEYFHGFSVVKVLSTEKLSMTTTPILSKRHSNCFFLNTRDERKSVLLINYYKNELEKVFMDHNSTEIYSMCSYITSKASEEILICSGLSKYLYIYNTHRKKLKDPEFIRLFDVDNYICSSFCLSFKNHKYLFTGSYYGVLCIYDISKESSHTKVYEKKLHNEQIFCFEIQSISFDCAAILSCSEDSEIKLFRVIDLCGMKDGVFEYEMLPEYYQTFCDDYQPKKEEEEEEEEEGEGERENQKDEDSMIPYFINYDETETQKKKTEKEEKMKKSKEEEEKEKLEEEKFLFPWKFGLVNEPILSETDTRRKVNTNSTRSSNKKKSGSLSPSSILSIKQKRKKKSGSGSSSNRLKFSPSKRRTVETLEQRKCRNKRSVVLNYNRPIGKVTPVVSKKKKEKTPGPADYNLSNYLYERTDFHKSPSKRKTGNKK